MPKARDLTNLIFGRLRVVEFAGSRRTSGGESKRTWLCVCDCGKETVVDAGAVITGNTISCGCFDRERRIKHGMHNDRFYQIWADMKVRCDVTTNQSYSGYGGRGICYDPMWKDFVNFREDMYDTYQDDLTLDRIDPNGNYCKENCRWLSKSEQGRNKTMLSTNTTGVTGVRKWVDSYNDHTYYVADAQGNKTKKSKYFSVNKYGEERAFNLACEWRSKFIEEFNSEGIVFSEHHGKEKESNAKN